MFTDKASGKDTKRAQLQAALDYLREGDSLVVHSMDRLARNLDDLRRIVLGLTSKGVLVEFAKERLTFTGEDVETCFALFSPLDVRFGEPKSLIWRGQPYRDQLVIIRV